jgi:hypothetical protein
MFTLTDSSFSSLTGIERNCFVKVVRAQTRSQCEEEMNKRVVLCRIPNKTGTPTEEDPDHGAADDTCKVWCLAAWFTLSVYVALLRSTRATIYSGSIKEERK